ncbi:hypothetical protein HRS9139_08965 [Pyrenophora teres f. teres]|nr:hypothetical protein HRS9139_08965 [Pyrenophora teres f. teres]KAE8843570.1 hypothetical protein HRS9122_04673 [Pyrenophora teres f. teres]KAE8861243.1 hypothetical protein PTNB29_06338 [Pyrenophora teres f. teres]
MLLRFQLDFTTQAKIPDISQCLGKISLQSPPWEYYVFSLLRTGLYGLSTVEHSIHSRVCPALYGPLFPEHTTVYHTYKGDLDIAHRALHTRYGPLVRIAPNEVLSSSPSAVPIIYRTQRPLAKSDWYTAFRPQGISPHADIFTETDEVKHTRFRKVVQSAYSMSNVLKNESVINECTSLLLKRLGDVAGTGQDVDLGYWLDLYAHDIIGYVLFGSSFGFLESGTDVGSFVESVEAAQPLSCLCAAAPSYLRTPIMLCAMCIPSTLKSFKAVGATAIEARNTTQRRMQDTADEAAKRTDILSNLLSRTTTPGDKSVPEDKAWFTHNEVVLEAWAGIMAGADSVAVNLRAFFYYLMKNPHCMSRAIEEVQNASTQGLLSTPITYHESTKHLPYVGACIKEAARIFPSFANSQARVAPAEGITLSGVYIPSGYRVGMNAACVQHDTGVFGDDAGSFNPERWLESHERSVAMEKSMLFFGAGTRTCLGKNVALAEIHKIAPEILRHFDMHMAHDRPWKTRNSGFNKQSDVIVKLTARI